MKFLSWDTSSKAGVVVAVECSDTDPRDVKLVSEFALHVDATHSERLLWAIHQVLASARWTLDEIDVLAVGTGPGSFTGLRIGVTTARTLAHTLGKPLIALSSLAALARPVAQYFESLGHEILVIAATDACKGELFTLWGSAKEVQKCWMQGSERESLLWSSVVQEVVLSPDQLLHSVLPVLNQENSKLRWTAVGEGVHRYPEMWSQLPQAQKVIFPLPFGHQVDGRALGMMACEAWHIQKEWSALSVFPRYLRASDAEIKLRSGLLPRSRTE